MILPSTLFEQVAAALSRGVAESGLTRSPDSDLQTAASSIAVPRGALESNLPSPVSPAEQRRRGPRVAVEAGESARLIPLTDAIAPGPIEVTLCDVAPGGARFLHAARIPLDEQFVLVLPSTDGPLAILCGVAYWQPVAENLFAIGARFNRVIHQGYPVSAQPASAARERAVAIRRAV